MPTATKKPTDPRLTSLRRSLALEGELAPESQFGLPELEKSYDTATKGFRAKYLAGLTLPDQVRTQAETLDPSLKLNRAGQEGRFAGNVDPNSPDYIDPSNILQFVGQRMQGGKEYLSRVTDAASRLWDRGVQSSRFAVDDAAGQLEGARTKYSERLKRAQALADDQDKMAFEARNDDVDRLLKLSQISENQAQASRAGSGAGAGDPSDLVQSILDQPALFDSLTPSQKQKIIPQLTAQGFDFLPAKARDSISAINAAKTVANQIRGYIGDVNTNTTPVNAFLGGLAASIGGKAQVPTKGSDASAALNRIKQSLVSTLSRGLGEKGVLTDYDIKRAQSLIPSPYDTKARAEQKLQQLDQFFSEVESRAYGTQTQSPAQLGLTQGPPKPGSTDPLGIRK
jgi:hypothetical protein